MVPCSLHDEMNSGPGPHPPPKGRDDVSLAPRLLLGLGRPCVRGCGGFRWQDQDTPSGSPRGLDGLDLWTLTFSWTSFGV